MVCDAFMKSFVCDGMAVSKSSDYPFSLSYFYHPVFLGYVSDLH